MSQPISDDDLLWPDSANSNAASLVPAVEVVADETVINWPAVVIAFGVVAATIGGVALYPPVRNAVGAAVFQTAAPVVDVPKSQLPSTLDEPRLEPMPAPQVLEVAAVVPVSAIENTDMEVAPPQPESVRAVTVKPLPAPVVKPVVVAVVGKPARAPVEPKPEIPAPKVAQVVSRKQDDTPVKPDMSVISTGDKTRCEELFKRGVVTSTEADIKAMTLKVAQFRGCQIRPGEPVGDGGEVVELIDPKNMVVRTNRRVLTIVD